MNFDFPFDIGPGLRSSSDDGLDIPPGADGIFPETARFANVEFLNLGTGEPGETYKVFYKKQYRKNHQTRQLVKHGGHGVIHMRAKTINCQLLRILGWVKREDQAAGKKKDRNGEVPIRNEDTGEQLNLIKDTDNLIATEDGYSLQSFSVDLHEIYEGNPGCRPVFELSKSDNDRKLNLFQLIIQLEFVDSSWEKFYSPIFNLRTETVPPTSQRAKKRKIEPDVEIACNANSPLLWSPGGSMDSGMSDERDSPRHRQILVDMLDAKTAKIGKLIVAHDSHFTSTGADLAYYMELKDPEDISSLEEGDLIGFFEDEESGQTYIQRLRSDNINKALHAGVISRSHYLAGHKPSNPNIKTDTVCVIGIVNVKVVGSVENGERIYASPNEPGKAIPASHMPIGSFLRKKHVLLGMALETKKCTKALDDVNLVKCFVCIVLDVSRKELLEEIEDLYEVNERRTEEQIKFANKKNWRRIRGCLLSSLIIIGVIIFILYQWLVPGSMFRYWMCRRGCIPNHRLHYKYRDEHTNRDYEVNGIQFTLQGLRSKVGIMFRRNVKCANGSSALYYLNVDRCAYYWADGAAGNNIGGRKYIGGATILSVAKNCSLVCEFEGDNDWKRVEKPSNVTCGMKP